MHWAAFSLSGEELRENTRKKERPRLEGEPAGAMKEGIYGAGSLAPINCFKEKAERRRKEGNLSVR